MEINKQSVGELLLNPLINYQRFFLDRNIEGWRNTAWKVVKAITNVLVYPVVWPMAWIGGKLLTSHIITLEDSQLSDTFLRWNRLGYVKPALALIQSPQFSQIGIITISRALLEPKQYFPELTLAILKSARIHEIPETILSSVMRTSLMQRRPYIFTQGLTQISRLSDKTLVDSLKNASSNQYWQFADFLIQELKKRDVTIGTNDLGFICSFCALNKNWAFVKKIHQIWEIPPEMFDQLRAIYPQEQV